MKFFSGFETDGSAWSDGNFSTRSWIATDSRFPGFDAEDAKAAQFDTIAGGKSVFHTEKHGIDGSLRLDAGQPGALRNFMHNILFDQVLTPLGLSDARRSLT